MLMTSISASVKADSPRPQHAIPWLWQLLTWDILSRVLQPESRLYNNYCTDALAIDPDLVPLLVLIHVVWLFVFPSGTSLSIRWRQSITFYCGDAIVVNGSMKMPATDFRCFSQLNSTRQIYICIYIGINRRKTGHEFYFTRPRLKPRLRTRTRTRTRERANVLHCGWI